MSYLLDFLFRLVDRISDWLLDLFESKPTKATRQPEKQPLQRNVQKPYVPSWERNPRSSKPLQSSHRIKSAYVPKRMRDANAFQPPKPEQRQSPVIAPSKPTQRPSSVITPPNSIPLSVKSSSQSLGLSEKNLFAEISTHYYNRTGQDITQSAKNKGSGGEMRTFGYLCSHFPKENVFCDVYLPFNNGIRSQVDIILITNFEIYIIENKNYQFPVYGGEYHDWVYYKNNKKRTIQNPIEQNRGHVNAFLQVFPFIPKKRVIPVVIFNNLAKLKITVKSFVMSRDNFYSFVEKRRTLYKPFFSKTDMQDLRETLIYYSVQSNEVKEAHLKYAKSRAEQAKQYRPDS